MAAAAVLGVVQVVGVCIVLLLLQVLLSSLGPDDMDAFVNSLLVEHVDLMLLYKYFSNSYNIKMCLMYLNECLNYYNFILQEYKIVFNARFSTPCIEK